ncbi:MAG: Flp pilus assembly complex ATPase component TadA [Firmicutes bacterium]|nr:Flp pilus assembly complex ATPase component TadA [Bacillota bacterium]
MSRPGHKRLGESLVDSGAITLEQLNDALAVQRRTGERLGRALVKLGYTTDAVIAAVIERQFGVPRISLTEYVVSPDVIALVPEAMARRYKVLPVEVAGNKLRLAMGDPLNVFAIDDVKIAAGLDVEPVVAPEDEVERALDQYYGSAEDIDQVVRDLEEFSDEAIQLAESEEEIGVDRLRELVDEAPVVRLVNMIVSQAVRDRASDIHVEPQAVSVKVRYRIDGMLREAMKIPRGSHAAIASRFKIMASMDIAERRVPQDGRVQLKVEGQEIDLRVSTLPTIHGEKVVCRVLFRRGAQVKLEQLGFLPYNLELWNRALARPHGIILVTGPTGSGKTQTLYASLNQLNSVDKNIITVEDPVEFRLDGINQVQTNVKAGLTFASGLRSMLRQDPDIIMVGEIRDRETAEIAVNAALTGHLVLSTLHTNDAPGATVRLVDMGVEPFLAASSLICVLSQRLVRKVCTKCAEEYVPDDESWGWWTRTTAKLSDRPALGLPRKLVHGKGCRACGDTGYSGRTAIHEIMMVNEPIRELVSRNAPSDEIAATARRQGMKRLIEDGAEKVLAGVTTIDEVLRVSAGEE